MGRKVEGQEGETSLLAYSDLSGHRNLLGCVVVSLYLFSTLFSLLII